MSSGTAFYLAEALIKKLEIITEDFQLQPDKQGFPLMPPKIINGYLPMKRSTKEPEAPFIIVRPKSGDDNLSQNTAVVSCELIIVTISEDDQGGYVDALNVCERIRGYLLSNRTLDKKYLLEGFSWDLPDEQPFPNWNIVVKVSYLIQMPQDTQFNNEI